MCSQKKMDNILRQTPANSNLSLSRLNENGILIRPVTPGTPLRPVDNFTNLEDLSRRFQRLSSNVVLEPKSNSKSGFVGAGDETLPKFEHPNPKKKLQHRIFTHALSYQAFSTESIKFSRNKNASEDQNGAESRPHDLTVNAHTPPGIPPVTGSSNVYEVQSTSIKVAYFDPEEFEELELGGIKEVYTCAATSTASYVNYNQNTQSAPGLPHLNYNSRNDDCQDSNSSQGEKDVPEACEVDDDDDDECPSSELEDNENYSEKIQMPSKPIPDHEKPFYTLENSHLYPELRQSNLIQRNVMPLFQPMGAPPLVVPSMNCYPPNISETVRNPRFDQPCSSRPDQCYDPNCIPTCDLSYVPNCNQNGNQYPNSDCVPNCNQNYNSSSDPFFQPRNATALQSQDLCSQAFASNPNCLPRLRTAQGNFQPRPQSGEQCGNFIGRIPAIYSQAPPTAVNPNCAPMNCCHPGFSTSGYGDARRAALFPTDCHRNFTAYSQSFGRAQTAPGFKIFQMPGHGPLTVPPRTAQNMLYQMGLGPAPPTATVGTNPKADFTAEAAAQIPEQTPTQEHLPSQAPGMENPSGHFSNNCNFFIYNVQDKGMAGMGQDCWEPSVTVSGPWNSTVADQIAAGVAGGQGLQRPPNFYKPNLHPVPCAAEIRSMLRPFRRFF